MLSDCKLCPRLCGVNRKNNELGFCGAGAKLKIARSALHFWEEPCISGENGSGTVFFSCCNMKCVFCQNYGISTQNKGVEITEEELADKFLMLQNEGAHNINLVTPSHVAPWVVEALRPVRQFLHIPVVCNCSGYESAEMLQMFARKTEA